MSVSHSDLKTEETPPALIMLAKACSTKYPVKALRYFTFAVTWFGLSAPEIVRYAELFNDENNALIKLPLEDYYKVYDLKTREEFLRARYERNCEDKPLIAIDVLQQIKAITKESPAVMRTKMINQYRWFLNHFAGDKEIRNKIEFELDREILTLGQAKGDFEHLLNIKYRLCIPFKLNSENVNQALANSLNDAAESTNKCTEIMDVLVHDVDTQRNADLQKEYIKRFEKNLQDREEKSAIAAKNLIMLYDKVLTAKGGFNGLKDKDRPEYLKRKTLAAVKLNLQHDLEVSQKDVDALKSQIETVIYSPHLSEVITTLLNETNQKQLQKSLVDHTESLLLVRESKSVAAASNLINFYAQCLLTKNAAVLPIGKVKVDMQKKLIELLCDVYLREEASDILRKQCKNYLKLLIKKDPQIEPQAKFALHFLRGIKYFSKNVPQNLLVCAKALIIMPNLAKEKVQPLYDWQNKLAPSGKAFKYGLFDDKKSHDQQYCELAKWYLEEIANARAASNTEAYLLQASVNGQPSYIKDHVVSGMKALGMSAKDIDHLQRLKNADSRQSEEKINLMECKQSLSLR